MVQVAAPHRDDFADFGVGGIVAQDDIFVPNELPVRSLDLLRGRKDMNVLREGVCAKKAKDNDKEFDFHNSTTILSDIYCKITTKSDYDRVSIRNLLQNYNKFRFYQVFYPKFTAKLQ